MVTPTRPPVAAADPTWRRIRALDAALQAVYLEAFEPAYDQAIETGSRFELPDGTRLDPTVAADTVACRAVNDAIATHIDTHLPGAELVGRADDSPTVIACSWRYRDLDTGDHLEITIEWDCTYDFGDPAGLSIIATKANLR